jgi:hypothetical protein
MGTGVRVNARDGNIREQTGTECGEAGMEGSGE